MALSLETLPLLLTHFLCRMLPKSIHDVGPYPLLDGLVQSIRIKEVHALTSQRLKKKKQAYLPVRDHLGRRRKNRSLPQAIQSKIRKIRDTSRFFQQATSSQPALSEPASGLHSSWTVSTRWIHGFGDLGSDLLFSPSQGKIIPRSKGGNSRAAR